MKLGFRVFKHDNKLKNDLPNSNDLTKVFEKSLKKKKNNTNNSKKIENNFKKQVIFPNIESSGWVVISRPQSYYLPHNVQPKYDTYTFNISLISNAAVITEVISFDETSDLKMIPFFEKETIVYDNSKTIGMYPVYEKNICYAIKFKTEISDEPKIKRLKIMETEKNIVINTLSWSDPLFSYKSKSKRKINMTETILSDLIGDEKMEFKKGDLSIFNNDSIIDSTLNDLSNSSVTNCKINTKNKIPNELNINVDQKTNKIMMTDSITILNDDNIVNNNEQYKSMASNVIQKDFRTELKLPSNCIYILCVMY